MFCKRFVRLHGFVMDGLEGMDVFVREYADIVYNVSRNARFSKAKTIELEINTDKLLHIIENKTPTLNICKYLCTILNLPHPFTCPSLSLTPLLKSLSLSPHPLHKQTYLTLVISSKPARTHFMQS